MNHQACYIRMFPYNYRETVKFKYQTNAKATRIYNDLGMWSMVTVV